MITKRKSKAFLKAMTSLLLIFSCQCQTNSENTTAQSDQDSIEVTPSADNAEVIITRPDGAKIKENDIVTFSSQCIAVAGETRSDLGENTQKVTIGKNRLIEGLNQALTGKTKGTTLRTKIPPEKAYGKKGLSPTIPPNAILECTIEILDHQPY